MPYVMTDDGFPDHPKVDALSDGAFRLQVAGMHYCAKGMTDGIVPRARAPRLTPHYRPRHLAELLDAGVWHEGGQGCGTTTCPKGEEGELVVHDFLEWNKPRAWWMKRRATEAKRVAEWREKRRDQPDL